MNLRSKPKIVILGMMTKMPVAGVVWQTVHYLVGFERLGCEAYYVEQHARTPSMFMETEQCDGSAKAAAFIDGVMRRFDLAGRWCLHALHEPEPRHFGMSDKQLRKLFAEADYIINLHGGTTPLPEHYATGRLVYLETDPVQLQIELHDGLQQSIDFLSPHCAFFSFGENVGNPDCGLPAPRQFKFLPTRQPVLCDLWDRGGTGGERFTTVGNWTQHWRAVQFLGQTYTWSKHFEFLKFIDLPSRTPQPFELALSSYTEADKAMLEAKGWHIRHGLDISTDSDKYRDYISQSRGEFTVAKDQNVRLRSGWFSDRTATYLAAGRPSITQETGFCNILPVGEGLFGFSTMEEILAAVEDINGDYQRHSAAALQIARECFGHDVVLGRILDALGVTTATDGKRARFARPPRDLPLTPVSRRPIRLLESAIRAVLDLVLPARKSHESPGRATKSIVIVTYNNLLLNKLGLLNLLEQTGELDVEVIVVDNASTDGTAAFLHDLAACDPRVRVIENPTNRGFAAATNQGLAASVGDTIVLLNNDTLVASGWLSRLASHLSDPSIGLLGAVTNRIGNQAEIPVDYATLGGFLRFAQERASSHSGRLLEIPMAAMFCLAMRRDTFKRLGPLDEQFEIGMFEDDDYAMRCREAGLRIVCAEDVFVHHFGEASFGELCPSGKYGEVFAANRARFEKKWDTQWISHEGRAKSEYRDLIERVHAAVLEHTPHGASVLIVSKGDPALVDIPGRRASHFPQSASGGYAGHHPADSANAITQLNELRGQGAEFLLLPRTSSWWLQHYEGFARYLEDRCSLTARDGDVGAIFDLREPDPAFNIALIVGCARSGTTILGELLAAHPAVKFLFEPHEIWERGGNGINQSHRLAAEHATPAVRRAIRDWFRQQQGTAALLVDKTPRNVLRTPFVRTIFPEAKIIHIVRDGRDVACSLMPGVGGEDWMHLKPPSWRELQEQHTGVGRCALAWKEIMQIALGDLADVPHLQIRYEQLVAAPQATARAVLQYAGLQDDPAVEAFCAKIQNCTAGSHHAAKQTHWYRDDHRQRVGRWRENLDAEQQAEVQQLLADPLSRLGYE